MEPEMYSPIIKEYNLHRSPLEQVYNEYSQMLHKHKNLLTHNYRTHEDILKLPSKFFYRDKVKSSNLIEKHPDFNPLMLLQSDDQEKYLPRFQSYFNEKEADKIVTLLKETLLPKWPATLWGKLEDNPNGIGIITTEYAQVQHIRTRLKKEQMPKLFVDTITNAQGQEFRVVILSVVRTHHSIDKDLLYKCSLYTEERVLNTAFTRVQSLIVTAAHPLSLITRGHRSCKLFWVSYLNQSLSDEECDQLREEFVKECQVGQVAGHCQFSAEDYEVYRMLIKDPTNIVDLSDVKKYDQILNDLEKDIEKDAGYQSGESDTLPDENYHGQTVNILEKDSDLRQGQFYVTTKLPITGLSLINLFTTTSMSKKAKSHRAFVQDIHSPYIKSPSGRQLYTITVIKGAESGYALTLDPKEKDIWLPDASALNRSLRGDTVAIDLSDTRSSKGVVISNMSSNDHPKVYFVCYIDSYSCNLLVPINKEYPKIDSRQQVEVNGLNIFIDNLPKQIACNIKFRDVGKYAYVVRLKLPWTKDHIYPKGVPVDHFKLEGDMTTLLNILKFNYIPTMPINNGKFLPYILNQAMQQFPIDWAIPHKERRKRKVHKDVFTIDDEDTVVLDDALSLEYDKDKNYIVNVHIADASYFIKPESSLDRVASERGRTFYINYEDDGAMFMLPDNICMEHGSLMPGKERLAVTTQFVFSKRDYSLLGQLSDVEVHRSIVCSLCRLTKKVAGKLLLKCSVQKPGNVTATKFMKLKEDLLTLGKIATKLRKSRWPDSHLYDPDRGKQDKYTMAGSSLVEMFMCLCNTAIPAKLLKRDGRVGPVLIHEPIKHYKQKEWLKDHYHLLEYCPIFKRMISDEAVASFNAEHQGSSIAGAQEDDSTDDISIVQDDQHSTAKPSNGFLMIPEENWNKICRLAITDNNDLLTCICSLNYFPELYVAYQQLCMKQSKWIYRVIDTASAAQFSKYKNDHFDSIYTHFTSPLRRYCDILVHRAILSDKNSMFPNTEMIHKMNIHMWDERKFSQQRNMLYLIDCCTNGTGAIATTAYVGKFTNVVMELHALPELLEIFPGRICELKLSRLQAQGDTKDNIHLLKWDVEIIPAPNNDSKSRPSKKESDTKEGLIQIPFSTLGAIIKILHEENFDKVKFEKIKEMIKNCKEKYTECIDFEQEVKPSCHKLTITKHIREYSKLDIQLTSSQAKSYAIEPTVSLVHISKTFSCCLLHVISPIQCYAPNISRFTTLWSPSAHNMLDYVESWQLAIEAESITNSTSSTRVPLIIKDLRLKWISPREAQFSVTSSYKIKHQRPFDIGDYVCIQYRNLLPNPKSRYFELDESKKVTWVAHGRIVSDYDSEDVEMIFPENTILPETPLSNKSCYLEVIPLQVTFRRIKMMFDRMIIKKGIHTNYALLEKICCRDYNEQIRAPDVTKDDNIYVAINEIQLNKDQNRAVKTALIPDNKLLLIQGPPGTGKSMVCVEMIKRFVGHNYKGTSFRGPTILYCAPSNKAVNVGACTMLKKCSDVDSAMMKKYSDVNINIIRVYGTIIEERKFPGLNKIPSLAKRIVTFKNEDASTVPEELEEWSLHFKIRDEYSDLTEVREFIKHENQLLSEDNLRKLQDKDYVELEEIRKAYSARKHRAEVAVLRTAQVVFCTCSETGSRRIKDSIGQAEQCIIDECGMCIEPETLLPMILSKKIILVGDHKQLQPVVLSKTAVSLGLKISMFQRMFEDESMSQYCIMLTEQYRMHPSICDFPSSQFYDNKLVAANEVLLRQWHGNLPHDIWKQQETQRCTFIHVEGTEETSGIDAKGSYGDSKFNITEAKRVKSVIKKLRNDVPEDDIMVLTPYRAHKDHIRELLSGEFKVDVNTVHESQGGERNVVILTTVRSQPEEDIPAYPSHTWVNENLGFLTDEHLINVAITRAKEALCIIGNKKLLEKHRMWRSLLDHYKGNTT